MRNTIMINTKSYTVALMLAIAFASVTVTHSSFAQKGNLGDEQINIVKAYQPMLSDAYKISDTPTRDTAVNYVPDMAYQVKKMKYPTAYTITPIKPVKVKDDQIKKLY